MEHGLHDVDVVRIGLVFLYADGSGIYLFLVLLLDPLESSQTLVVAQVVTFI